ncbi:RHOMBOID-like protein 2 [Physcomitrium patens]|uniref:RHOMBOID-like protein n=1 Tax=Physcomitrium patens TaxID=3218 RepID=A0A2K1L109_PHYPA|nr:RHOMBOID-like protein 2 [Physcomitrium patens]PNR59701.1 hypothetical protein PHYPA_002493 [Physcomitrium patens]|eukprot:XP_024398484.1 RHOMBOID-like protein 2 [Physcomitrella patens]
MGDTFSMGKSTSPYNGMFPSHISPVRKRDRYYWPIFTLAAVVANVIIFIIVMYDNNCPANIIPPDRCVLGSFRRMSFQPWNQNPLLGPSSATLQRMGGLMTFLVVDQQQGWRLMSCVWLHAGVFHLVINMTALLIFGIQLEKEFGIIRVGLLYLISGLGGGLLSTLFNSHAISVGASGALFGLAGATLAELITNWSHFHNRCSLTWQLIIVAAVNFSIGLMPRVDNFAHIGGFITGLLLGFVLLMKEQYGYVWQRDLVDPNIERPMKRRFKVYQIVLFVASILLLITGFIAGFIALYNNVDINEICRWCRRINCVPSPRWSCNSTSG